MAVESRLTVRLIDDDDRNEITIERLSPNDETDGPLFAFSQTSGSVNLTLKDLGVLRDALYELIQRNGSIPDEP